MSLFKSVFEIESYENGKILSLAFNEPQKGNAFGNEFWELFTDIISEIESSEAIVVIIKANGGNFSFGIDLIEFFSGEELSKDDSISREILLNLIKKLQNCFLKIYYSSKIYISCVQGYCIGAGLDLISICDLRVASQTAKVSLREARVGIVADLGALYFLPKIIGVGNTKYMALTGKDFTAVECKEMGLFQSIFETDEGMVAAGFELAKSILECSPLALRGVKKNIHYSISHSVEDSMDYVATWNASFLNNKDLQESILAFKEKRKPRFS